MWKIAIILLLIYNLRAMWSVAKFRPERSFGWKWNWFYPKENDEDYWLRDNYPDLFQNYCDKRDQNDNMTYANDGFHMAQGAMNVVIMFGLLWIAFSLAMALLVTLPLFFVLESVVFNPLLHWAYTRKGYCDLWRSSPWKFILKNPRKE